MNSKIYTCNLSFHYTKHYISVIVIADDYNDAKNKFISICLDKYDEITRIDFEMFYDKHEAYYGPPVKFDNILDFEKYLVEHINEDAIECLHTSKFEINDKYDC